MSVSPAGGDPGVGGQGPDGNGGAGSPRGDAAKGIAAAIAFYGAIEQVLTGWIFGLLPRGEEHYEQAKRLVVETICGGLDASDGGASL